MDGASGDKSGKVDDANVVNFGVRSSIQLLVMLIKLRHPDATTWESPCGEGRDPRLVSTGAVRAADRRPLHAFISTANPVPQMVAVGPGLRRDDGCGGGRSRHLMSPVAGGLHPPPNVILGLVPRLSGWCHCNTRSSWSDGGIACGGGSGFAMSWMVRLSIRLARTRRANVSGLSTWR